MNSYYSSFDDVFQQVTDADFDFYNVSSDTQSYAVPQSTSAYITPTTEMVQAVSATQTSYYSPTQLQQRPSNRTIQSPAQLQTPLLSQQSHVQLQQHPHIPYSDAHQQSHGLAETLYAQQALNSTAVGHSSMLQHQDMSFVVSPQAANSPPSVASISATSSVHQPLSPSVLVSQGQTPPPPQVTTPARRTNSHPVLAHYSGITTTAPPPQQQTSVPSQTLQFAPHTNQFRQLQVQIPPPGVFLQHQQQRVPQLDSLQSTPSAQQNRQPYQSELLHALTPVQPSPRVQRPASTVPTSVYPRNQEAALRNSSPTQFAFSPSSLRRHSMYEPSTNASYMTGQIPPIAEHALPGGMLEYTYEPSPSYSLNGALDYAYSSGNNSAPTTARTTSSSATLASPPLGASLSPTAVQTSTPKSFSAEDEHRVQLGTVAGQDMMVDLGTQDLYQQTHSPTEMNLKPAAIITIPTAMDVDSKDGIISIPPAEVYNDPPSLSTRSKRRSSVPTGPAPKRARSIPTVDNRPIASGSAAPLVVKSDPGNSPPIDEADDDDDWQAPRVGQSRSRPRPHRTGSGSSSRSQKDANSKNPMTRNLKSNADLVGLAKLNDVQRRHVLMADPLSGNVEPTRVFCTSCNKWVKLGEGVKYRIRHWVGHVVLVHKRPREESDKIQAQGIVNANSDSGPAHVMAPKLPAGRKGRTRDGSESDEEQPLAVLSRRRKSQSEGIAPVAAEAGSSLPSAAREDSPLTPVSSPTAPPATVLTKNGNFLNNVSATKTMRSRAHADGESANANKTPAREYAGNDSNRPWSSGGS